MMAGKPINGPSKQWLNVYELSGFAVGSPLLIQNQTGYTWVSSAQADSPDSVGGLWIYPGQSAQVDADSDGFWIYSEQPITAYVQEDR